MSSTTLIISGSFLAGVIIGFLLTKVFSNNLGTEGDENTSFIKQQLLDSTQELEKERKKYQDALVEATKVSEQLLSEQVQKEFLEKSRADLLTQFRSLSSEMLKGSRDALLKTNEEMIGKPLSKQVEQLKKQMQTMQKESAEKLGALAQSTNDLRKKSEDVHGAAQQLTSALKSPNVKGRWGEINLRRILEFVGLINYCDFNEQVLLRTDDSSYRPDCVLTIPGTRKLIIDSKAPIESYLNALKAQDEDQRESFLSEHLRKVRSHIDQLSKKEYVSRFNSNEQVIDGVVLYIPVEGALSMALERDPELLEYAFSKNIILTFPTSLLAILKGLAMTIQQAELNQNIEVIQKEGVELYKRFLLMTEKFTSIGKNISALNKSYNDAVGSFDRRLIPQGRRFGELAGQTNHAKIPDVIEDNIREINTKQP